MAVLAVLLGTLAAKLSSPDLIIAAVVVGFLAKKWVHVAIGAVAAATLNEVILTAIQASRDFSPAIWLIGVLAAAVWASLVFFVRQRFSGSS